ncbi:MAG: hypothetical protein M3Y72_06275 [Acidobacteriota bacterium]|nr:hypothetical protein [Acidobacteriota bacterium]
MNTPRTSTPANRNASAGGPTADSEKPGFRTKTVATRITPEELAEVEAAAQRDGKTLAEWLRELALKAARQCPADPMELLLSEVAAIRYMLLNLFHATAQANGEGKHLLADSVLKIRDTADAKKLQMARKMIQDFFAQEGQTGGQP